jgi:hypothetical protein
VEVEAPDHRDPSQMVALWKKVQDLMQLLSASESLMNLEIYFQDTDFGKWFLDGEPRQTITPEYNANEFPNNIKAIVLLFCKLCNVRHVTFHLPKKDEGTTSLIERCNHAMTSEARYQEVQTELDTIFMQFDRALDTLSGPTARFLRLERFCSWYIKDRKAKTLHESQYVKELERIHKTGKVDPRWNSPEAIQQRYLLALCFNPLNKNM